eukprot:CAMPEP_0197173564 /NCGR_PEP_ID=MMETSP1423-20130617/449_1 /TAXON_ID=476441 /ORGANISM="Pseudo-nitzschia heimii, Strain UNC1101" /LENGTH=398 /DNA_ID=CAMNT_0042622397 /DNA_START=87 /DNA_END=1283 /DNA_ORIENTATION=+
MNISKQLVTLFLAQQALTASAFAPKTSFQTSTALNYKINEAKLFQDEQLTSAPGLADLKKNYVANPANTAKRVPQKANEVAAQPEIGGLKKFDLAASKAARTPKHMGAVRGAFKSLIETKSVKNVQGGKCLKTWNIMDNSIDRVSVMLNNEGVPLSAQVEIWQGPESTPLRLQVASEDGYIYPFSAVLETPSQHNSVAVRNMSPMEYNMGACVVADVEDARAGGNKLAGQGAVVQALSDFGEPFVVHGSEGVESFQFESTVESIQVLLETDGRPLHARIELVQGTDDNKQVIDIMSENGQIQPFFAVIDTPTLSMGAGATVRVVNTAPSTVFPLTAMVEPYLVTDDYVHPIAQETKVDNSDDLFFLSADDDAEELTLDDPSSANKKYGTKMINNPFQI